jgi:peptide/nickel transport system substrate-binding protein
MPSSLRAALRILGAATLAASALLPAPATVTAAGPLVLKLGTIENLRSLNPYQAAYFPDYETFQLNFSLLVDIGPNLEPYPAFADKWERSADGKSWKFHIRSGMKWSDGEPATSADACFSFGLDIDAIKHDTNVGNGYIDPALKDARVTSAECPDPETMLLFTDDGTTKVLKTSIPILPKHIYGKETYKTIGKNDFKPPLVGTGQYQVKEYTADESVHLVRNPYWYGQKGAADEIYIQIFKNADTMVQSLKRGDIDYARAVPVEQFNQLNGQPNIQTVAGKLAGWDELGFNNYGTGTGKTIAGGGPSTKALQDPAFRSALGYAIDKQQLLDKVYGGHGVVGSTQVPPVIENKEANPPFFWHTEPNDLRTFDIATANAKLEEAGYHLDANGQRLDKEGKPINLHLVMPDSDATYPQIAQFIQAWFGQVGIKVKSDVIEENSLYDIMLPPEGGDPSYKADYDMFIWSWFETVEPNTLLEVFRCDEIGASSDSLWCNHDYDKLYDQQNLAPDDQARKQIIDQMQQLFYDQAPYHILYYPDELDAYRTDKFGGWQNQPLDGGYPLFSYSVIDYQFLTDAAAAPSPTTAPSNAAPNPSAATTPVASAPAAVVPTKSTSSGPDATLLVAVAAVVIIIIGGMVLFGRRRRAAEDDE